MGPPSKFLAENEGRHHNRALQMKQTKGLQALGIAFFGSLAGAALGTPFVYKTVRYLALENPCCLWIYLAGKPIDT
jgi:heme oxygenase